MGQGEGPYFPTPRPLASWCRGVLWLSVIGRRRDSPPARPTSVGARFVQPLGPWPEAIPDYFVRDLEVGLPMELPPAFGFHTGASTGGLLSCREVVRRFLPAFGPSWGTGYPSSVFRLPPDPGSMLTRMLGDKRFGGHSAAGLSPTIRSLDRRRHSAGRTGIWRPQAQFSRKRIAAAASSRTGLTAAGLAPGAASLSASLGRSMPEQWPVASKIMNKIRIQTEGREGREVV